MPLTSSSLPLQVGASLRITALSIVALYAKRQQVCLFGYRALAFLGLLTYFGSLEFCTAARCLSETKASH